MRRGAEERCHRRGDNAAKSFGVFKIVGKPFAEERYGIGVKKGDTGLSTKINDALTKMVQDGSWKAAFARTWDRQASPRQHRRRSTKKRSLAEAMLGGWFRRCPSDDRSHGPRNRPRDRDVLGDHTHQSLACRGETMTTVEMANYAYDQIDQARTGLGRRLDSRDAASADVRSPATVPLKPRTATECSGVATAPTPWPRRHVIESALPILTTQRHPAMFPAHHSGLGSPLRVAGCPQVRPEPAGWRPNNPVPGDGSDPWIGL